MAIEISIPRLGWSMDEGVFVGWHKTHGDFVEIGDPLFALEGEKATQDVEAIDRGILQIPSTSPLPGQTVAVSTVIGYLISAGEVVAPVQTKTPLEKSPQVVSVIEAKPPLATKQKRHRSSPLARRLAVELGIDITTLTGSGNLGRIRRDDVLAARNTKTLNTQTDVSARTSQIAITPIRRIIAERLSESHRSVVPVTLTTTIDASNLINLRRQFKVSVGPDQIIPAIHDIVIKLAAVAIIEFPMINSTWSEQAILQHTEINIGLAVETDQGLVVPVVAGADRLGLKQITKSSQSLIERARTRGLRADDLKNGTFTITNLGVFGVDSFTPVINLPQCAILGLGRIDRRPVMDGDRVIGRDQMTLSLTFDHRILDGAPAARFLQRIGQLIENPAPWLVG
jgi:pyruvate dehydrogenase E2 component (dihydrolipoamide acetyltransferase)